MTVTAHDVAQAIQGAKLSATGGDWFVSAKAVHPAGGDIVVKVVLVSPKEQRDVTIEIPPEVLLLRDQRESLATWLLRTLQAHLVASPIASAGSVFILRVENA